MLIRYRFFERGIIPGIGKADSPEDDSRIGLSTILSASRGDLAEGGIGDGQSDRDYPR
jgi:hypothetical protein